MAQASPVLAQQWKRGPENRAVAVVSQQAGQEPGTQDSQVHTLTHRSNRVEVAHSSGVSGCDGAQRITERRQDGPLVQRTALPQHLHGHGGVTLIIGIRRAQAILNHTHQVRMHAELVHFAVAGTEPRRIQAYAGRRRRSQHRFHHEIPEPVQLKRIPQRGKHQAHSRSCGVPVPEQRHAQAIADPVSFHCDLSAAGLQRSQGVRGVPRRMQQGALQLRHNPALPEQ